MQSLNFHTHLTNKKRKILYFISEDWYFWSHRLPLAKAARDSGWNVSITTRVSNFKENICKEHLNLIPLAKFRRRVQSPLKEINSFLELLKIYRKVQPNIAHHVAFKPVLYGTIAARLTGVDSTVNALAGLGFLFTSENKNISFPQRVILLLLRLLFNTKKVRLILQNTDDMYLMLSHNVVRKDQVVLIKGSGVDPQLFVPHSELPGLPIVLLPSRMLWDKGVKEFVQAARLLNSDDRIARFVLIGAPDPENPASIPVSLLNKWQVNGDIEWWGQRFDMPEVLAQVHIVCLPSYREGLPKALLEAGASGRPIVTTNTTGCKEVVHQGVNGILVPPRDTEALVNALKTLLDDPKLRVSMGMKGREIVLKEYSEEKIVRETISLYSTMLSKK